MNAELLRLRIPFALRTEYFAQDDRGKLLGDRKISHKKAKAAIVIAAFAMN
jgi:hypothetical protein